MMRQARAMEDTLDLITLNPEVSHFPLGFLPKITFAIKTFLVYRGNHVCTRALVSTSSQKNLF